MGRHPCRCPEYCCHGISRQIFFAIRRSAIFGQRQKKAHHFQGATFCICSSMLRRQNVFEQESKTWPESSFARWLDPGHSCVRTLSMNTYKTTRCHNLEAHNSALHLRHSLFVAQILFWAASVQYETLLYWKDPFQTFSPNVCRGASWEDRLCLVIIGTAVSISGSYSGRSPVRIPLSDWDIVAFPRLSRLLLW